MGNDLGELLAQFSLRFETVFEQRLPASTVPGIDRVTQAMRHGALGGGKRIRPFLVVQSSVLFGIGEAVALPVAAALECVHCYSLVHDDLPSMDNDALRRGQPTVHIAFDEATAILAGDGLLTRAFGLLGAIPTSEIAPEIRLELITTLATAAGTQGMIGGQMRDIEAENESLDLDGIVALQAMKTGALIEWAVLAGPILAQASAPERAALSEYARNLGLIFQITDDLLDFQGDATLVGKAVGKDAGAGKGTFVSHLGPDGARQRSAMLTDQAVAALDMFGTKANTLADLARFVLNREK